MKLILKLGAIAAAIAAILGLAYLIDPNIKPQPAPSVTSGKITEIDWEQPSDSNVNYYVDVEIVGYNGQTCALGYSVYTANGQYTGISDTDVEDFQAQSNDDTGGDTIPVEKPSEAGTYYVIFTLYAPNGTKLNVLNSANFNIN